MKLRTLAALVCALVLSLGAAGAVFAHDECNTEQGTQTDCPSSTASASGEEETASPSGNEETASPTGDAESESPSGAETPSGGEVEGVTGTPSVTLPPTDGLSGNTGDGSGGVPIAILAMAGLLAAVLLMTPATAGLRRGKRRD